MCDKHSLLKNVEREKLFSCLSWDIEKRSCKAKYNCFVSKKHEHITFNLNDFDKDCKGQSNKSRCIAFKGIELSRRELEFQNMKEQSDKEIKVIERKKVF